MFIIGKSPKADCFFEVSWEVCNKVGGIYTVVSSKAELMVKYYKNYFLIGPYFPKKAFGEFQETAPPEEFKSVFDELRNEGIICHFGKWLIAGTPSTILIDFAEYTKKNNEIKTQLWNDYQIDSLGTQYFDFDEPNLWSHATGRVIDFLSKKISRSVVAQFHEWLSAAGLLYLRKNNQNVATVFTTHATVLGRTLASAHVDLYNLLEKINPEEEARKYKIQPKFLAERAAAVHADIFTTVSEITGIEASFFLGRKPEIILPNGLNLAKFPTMEEIAIKHKLMKTKINSFLLYYFFPYYSFDLINTYVFFIVGRYEYHDKGINIFINALGRLNKILKDEKSEKTVVAFLWIPANVRGIKAQVLENRANFIDIHESIEDSMVDIRNSLTISVATNKEISADSVFGSELFRELRRKAMNLNKKGVPPLSTHDFYNEEGDEILNGLRENGLSNSKEDKVKIIYYPIYLTGADSLLDLNYYESMAGAQLGVFPSYYEPWGYTPLEAAALGVSSVTTDLAGFGRYISDEMEQKKLPGIYVIKRLNKPDEQVTEKLKDVFYNYIQLTKEERIANKYEAKKISAECNWSHFAEFYIEAHNLAVEKHKS